MRKFLRDAHSASEGVMRKITANRISIEGFLFLLIGSAMVYVPDSFINVNIATDNWFKHVETAWCSAVHRYERTPSSYQTVCRNFLVPNTRVVQVKTGVSLLERNCGIRSEKAIPAVFFFLLVMKEASGRMVLLHPTNKRIWNLYNVFRLFFIVLVLLNSYYRRRVTVLD